MSDVSSENAHLVTAIIVNYKSAELTLLGLESLLKERTSLHHIHLQAIVVENDSGDADVLQSEIERRGWSEWVQLIDSKVNGGFGYGNNLGFKQGFAQGKVDFFYLLNPDARCFEGAIAALVDALNEDSSAGIAGSTFVNDDGSPWKIAFRFPSLFSEIDAGFRIGFISRLLSRWRLAVEMKQFKQNIDWVAGASMMIKSDVVKLLKGFDESFFLYYEETDLCKRAKRLGYNTIYVPESKVLHVAGQSTKVTERNAKRKRFPAYWYQSRSLYYLKNHGVFYALIADFLALLTYCIGNIRLVLFGKAIETPLGYFTDTLKNTVFNPLVRANRAFRSMLQ